MYFRIFAKDSSLQLNSAFNCSIVMFVRKYKNEFLSATKYRGEIDEAEC